jgi:hypothetical protein
MERVMTVQMRKGEIFADIFDSPETISQARRDGYSLVDPEEIEKRGENLDELTKPELLELAKRKGVFEKSLSQYKKSEIIEMIKVANPEPQKPEENPKDPEPGKPPEPAGNQGSGKVPGGNQGSEETPSAGGAGNKGPAAGTGETPKEKHGFFGGGRK